MKTPLPLRLGCLALLAAAGFCQTPPAPPPINREFDFWIGEWDVTTPDGKTAGTNRIEAVLGGRALLENWQGSAQPNGQPGVPGKSLNAYDPAAQRWRQFWVGGGGAVFEITGGLVDGKMILSGERTLRDGRTQRNRITWTPNADGTVRQLWEQSLDAGATWTTAFDGLYRRRAPEPVDPQALVRDYYAAYNAKDVPRLLAFYADDVHLVDPTFEIDIRGRAEIERALGPAVSAYDEINWQPAHIATAGNVVTIEGAVRGKFRGKLFEMKFATLLTLRDGKIARHHDYLDSTAFFAQIGRVPPRIKKMLEAAPAK